MEEVGGIEPLPHIRRTPVFQTGVYTNNTTTSKLSGILPLDDSGHDVPTDRIRTYMTGAGPMGLEPMPLRRQRNVLTTDTTALNEK